MSRMLWGWMLVLICAGGALAEERFVPPTARWSGGAVLEVRQQATVSGAQVRLRQVCRWAESDEAFFAPVADLVLVRMDGRRAYGSLGLEELKTTLHDAGLNLALVRFSGATSCAISRTDTQIDGGEALQQWLNRSEPAAAAEPQPAAGDPAPAQETLSDLLLADLADRLNLPIERVQISFHGKDQKLAAMTAPPMQFQIEPRRVANLGPVSWEVTVRGAAGTQTAMITGTARAWQDQLVAARPMQIRQTIRDEDVVEKRSLVDRISDEPLLTRGQVVGQQAALTLQAGTVLTARMVESTPLVQSGQLVTVTLGQGRVQLKTVARAMDTGTFGQTIRVRNEVTRETFDVVVSGPQTATLASAAN